MFLHQGRPTSVIPIPLAAADIRARAVARHHLQRSCPVHRRFIPPLDHEFYFLLKF